MNELSEMQPLDLSCPPAAVGPPFWGLHDVKTNHPTNPVKSDIFATNHLSVSIPRRYSNCSDNVSFDRSPSVSPTSDRGRGPVRGVNSDSDMSPSDFEGDCGTLSPPALGPATKRFLSKYIKEQIGKLIFSSFFFFFLIFIKYQLYR